MIAGPRPEVILIHRERRENTGPVVTRSSRRLALVLLRNGVESGRVIHRQHHSESDPVQDEAGEQGIMLADGVIAISVTTRARGVTDAVPPSLFFAGGVLEARPYWTRFASDCRSNA